MSKQFWINLPVKDVSRSKEFFGKLGFRFNPQYPDSPNAASLLLGDHNVVVMLFDEPTFQSYTNSEITNTHQSSEVLLSIDADSKEEVDELVRKAVDAGGTSSHQPSEMTGWMYGCVFADPDGHRWNILHMDMSKMPH
jgi:predicted lactoylglutathione lyase